MLTTWLFAALLPLQADAPPPVRCFVAPDGDDALDGEAPRRNATSGPFRTLRRAFDEVRKARRANGGDLPATALIELVAGTYVLDEPLLLTSDDGGSDHGPVYVFVVAPEDQPPGAGPPRATISGGRRITDWHRETVAGRDLFVAELADVKAGRWHFRELFVNGERRTRARHPDRGYLAVAALHATDAPKPWNEPVSQFFAEPADLAPLRDDPHADVTVMCRWIENHVRTAAVDLASGLVTLLDPTVFKVDRGDPYYIECAAALDAPGEWWLDEATGRLLVVPRPGEELTSAEVIAPRLDRLLELAGDPATSRFVERITFENVDFAHAQWWFPPPTEPGGPRASGFPQAAVGVPGAIAAVGAHRCRFEKCSVRHVGGYAVELGRGCRDNALVDCDLTDLGGGGVKIGTTAIASSQNDRAQSNSVTGCRIVDGGRVFHSAIGIWVGQSPANTIERSEIADFYYTGISLGWTWGYGAADAGGQLIDGNHVHHIGQRRDGDGPILSDMGGIYTLGAHGGTTIQGNWFHDIAALRYGGWGIYFDEGTSRILARQNLVVRTTHGGFHQHYGRDNVVENNVFAAGRDAQLQRTRVEEHQSFTFRNNVVLWKQGELLAGDFVNDGVELLSNLYWRFGGGEISFAGGTFAEWQARGRDAGSQIADPCFSSVESDDWSVAPGSVAATILNLPGFVAPISEVFPWHR